MQNIFELTLRLKGFPIRKAKETLQQIQDISEAKYPNYVQEQRDAIVQYHKEHNTFYQDFLAGVPVTSWETLPIMTKADLQQPLAQRLSHGYTPKNVYVNKTSGSSGHPFVFAKDLFCHALTWAEIMDRFGWYDLDFHRSLQARFYGIPLDRWGYQKERLKDRLSARYRFPIFDLSEEKMHAFLSVFRRKPFTYINGYTSAIVLFAKFLKKQGLVLKEECPSLNYCIVTSEMLYDSDKRLMETVFDVPVVNEYGASELDLIAFTNREDRFVVNSETLFVEIVNAQGIPVPNGTTGRIVITSLYNKAHPMIRYDIGDWGALSEDSTPKAPILKKLVGRTNDVALLPGGKQVPGLTFYYVTKSVIEDDGNVTEFVVAQTGAEAFRITYVSERALNKKEISTIQKALERYVGSRLELSFERKEVLERSARGKLKQFISEL